MSGGIVTEAAPASMGARIANVSTRGFRAAVAMAWHYGVCTALWLDQARARRAAGEPRVMATICWTFPVYSHNFVYQELLQVHRAGFPLRILYLGDGKPEHLGDSYQALRGLAVRTTGSHFVAKRALRFFRRRAPDRVDEVLRLLASHTGMTPAALLQTEHVLLAFTFARYAHAYRAEYIHSYFFYESTLFALVAATLLGLPRGVSCYADHMLQDYPFKMIPAQLARLDVVIATSARIARELSQMNPSAAPRILVKPNAVDVQDWTPAATARSGIVAVSRIDRKKGLEYLIDAVAVLRDRGITAMVRILGAPDDNEDSRRYDAELRAQVAQHGLDGQISLPGMATRASVRSALMEAAIFVLPAVDLPNGDKDGIPTALLEAMACALPPVATDAGSITEVISDGENGRVVPQRDPEALADALAPLLTDADARHAMGANARQTVATRFDVAVCETQFHTAIRRASDHAVARRTATLSPASRSAHTTRIL